jgi:hypothetical protein
MPLFASCGNLELSAKAFRVGLRGGNALSFGTRATVGNSCPDLKIPLANL